MNWTYDRHSNDPAQPTRFSLGFILAISLAGLQFVAIITVVLTSYLSSEVAMLTHARSLLSKAGTASVENSIRFLEPASDVADLSRRVVEAGIIDANDHRALEVFLFQQLLNEPQFSGIFYGDEDGNFVFVMRDHEQGSFRTKTVRIDAVSYTHLTLPTIYSV